MIEMKTYTYKNVDGQDIVFDVFRPDTDEVLPAIVLVFGGGWKNGDNTKFHPQAKRFAGHGYAVFTPDYRTYSRHSVSPRECVDDITDFWKQLHDRAKEFKIDDSKIALGGGSAGAHLALMAAIRSDLLPAAFILYNPALNPNSFLLKLKIIYPNRKNYPLVKDGMNYNSFKDIDVLSQLPTHFPPTVLFHGKRDTLIPYFSSVRLKKKIERTGAYAEIHLYKGQKHGFFNEFRNIDAFNDTNEKVIAFLDAKLK